MEQSLVKAWWWWFVGLILGLSLRILWGAIKGNIRKVSDLDDYIRDNTVVLTFVAICYSVLCILWRTTDLVAYLPLLDRIDIFPRVINAWSIVVCFLADLILLYVIRKFQDKIRPQDPIA